MKARVLEVVRFGMNGIFATVVHFAVLSFNLEVIDMNSAGLANLIAVSVGITVSFVGNCYFVFPRASKSLFIQVAQFSCLYFFIAFLHGAILYFWTDRMGHDYRIGFLLATVMQVSMSYLGNKMLVFRQ